MEQINYEGLLPLEPRSDVVRLALEAGRFTNSYLIYRADKRYLPLEDRMEPAVRVICTACGASFLADKIDCGGCGRGGYSAPFGWMSPNENKAIISGEKTRCPACEREAQTIYVGNISTHHGELVDDAWVTEFLRLPAEGMRARLALLDWCVRRCTGKDGRTRYEIWPYTAWVAEEKKVVRLMGYGKPPGGTIFLFGRWKQRKTFSNVYGSADVVAPLDPALPEGTTAENCKLDLYLAAGGKRLVGYLALWRRHPAVENLLVQGCGALVEEWIRREEESSLYHGGVPKLPAINWRERRPARMLGLTREEFRHLRRERWHREDLERYKLVRDAGAPVRLPEDMTPLRSFDSYTLERILEEAPKPDFWRILRYLQRQGRDWPLLRDYWRMAERLNRDLTDSLVRWPRDLLLAHDLVTGQQKKTEEDALRARFQARFAALEPLSLQLDGLFIRPCRDQRELIAEGRALHHCVATYAEGHASGRTAIFFIRRADSPQEPWFTLELDEEKLVVRQNRGLRNCEPPEEVRDFTARWLSWLRKGDKKTE